MWIVLTGEKATVLDDSESIGYELAGSSAVFQGKYKRVLTCLRRGPENGSSTT